VPPATATHMKRDIGQAIVFDDERVGESGWVGIGAICLSNDKIRGAEDRA